MLIIQTRPPKCDDRLKKTHFENKKIKKHENIQSVFTNIVLIWLMLVV